MNPPFHSIVLRLSLSTLLLWEILLLLLLLVFVSNNHPLCSSQAFELQKSNGKYYRHRHQWKDKHHDNHDDEITNHYKNLGTKWTPITVLSGFLGSGKTTFLQYLLTQQNTLKIAVIVNDVASVNIDSKLLLSGKQQQNQENSIKSSGEGNNKVDIIELQNGCACCSLADELLASVAEVVTLSDLRSMAGSNDAEGDDEFQNGPFDHIVIELSGVAEPRAVRANFQEAQAYDMPLMERVCLDTMVTVIDCSSFLENIRSGRGTNPDDSPELFYRNADEQKLAENNDSFVDEMDGTVDSIVNVLSPSNESPDAPNSVVSELLIDQTEVADVILLNKVDLVESEEQLEKIENIIRALNPTAEIIRTEFGSVNDIDSVLGAYGGKGAADAGIIDDHKDAVKAAKAAFSDKTNGKKETSILHHDHRHDYENNNIATSLDDHSHDHSHTCSDPTCVDPTHDHSHNHDHHSDVSCVDPNCTDPNHSHSHSHNHVGMANAIGTYVYSARRPFHPGRLASLVTTLPVSRGIPQSNSAEHHVSDSLKAVMKNVLRSKGFVWLANSNIAAYYWAHAGASFELQVSRSNNFPTINE